MTRQRTSLLAGCAFLSGLSAALLVGSAGALVFLVEWGDALWLRFEERKVLLLSARILLFCATAPAVSALGFWLGARAAVREGGGAVRGVGLYRAGLSLSILSLLGAFGGANTPAGHVRAALERHAAGSPYLRPAPEYPFSSRMHLEPVPLDLPGDQWGRATVLELRRRLPFVLHDGELRDRVQTRLRKEWPGGELHDRIRLTAERPGARIRVEAWGRTPEEAAGLAKAMAEEWIEVSRDRLVSEARENLSSLAREIREERDGTRRAALESEREQWDRYLKNPQAPLRRPGSDRVEREN